MKHLLLSSFFCFLSFLALAQDHGTCSGCLYGNNNNNNNNNSSSSNNNNSSSSYAYSASKTAIMIYPNPATEFIGVKDNDERVSEIILFSITGRKVRSFDVLKDEKYYVGDIADGMYLIQIIGKDGRIVTTQRLNKK
jgi:hypothetical protein